MKWLHIFTAMHIDSRMNASFIILLLCWSCLLLVSDLEAQNSWQIAIALGDAYCAPAPLFLRQNGFSDLKLTARFATHSFQPPIYYAIKVGHYSDVNGWELEFIHLKIKLKNKIEDIQRFEISHGFNLLTVLRSWKRHNFNWQIGVALVLAHPENTVRNLKLSETKGLLHSGYYIAGPNIQLSLVRTLIRWSDFSIFISGKFTGAYCWIPIAQGWSQLVTLNLHGLIGLAYAF